MTAFAASAPPAAPTAASGWRTLRVADRRREAEDIHRFVLEPADGAPLAPYRAGAHLWLRAGPWLRPYSLCAPHGGGRYQIAVQREAGGRGGSRHLCDKLEPGDEIEAGEPANHFPLAEDMPAPPLLLAGGIGITPILCMARELAAAGRACTLHYLARSRRRMAFLDELAGWAASGPGRLHLHAGDEPGGAPGLAALVGPAQPGRHLYVCGPAGMLDAVRAHAAAQGWRADHVHFERFGAAEPAPPAGGDAAFEVVLASSGRRVPVPAGTTVAQALHAAGVDLPVSCEQGVCGACATRVLAGRPDHRDSLLDEAERAAGQVFLPCCSRSLDPSLTLDL